MEVLIDILKHMRPHESSTERMIADKHIMSLPGARRDEKGNIIVVVGEGSRTLFSCHTDTVHHEEGKQGLMYDQEMGVVYVAGETGGVLGADDGAGMWLMRKMILAGVKGTYVFHAGEECGGIGSSWLAKNHPEWLKGFDRAIAFDRKDTGHVITHQGFEQCCSNLFAGALADALNSAGPLGYAPNDSGIYTDTREYTHLIPECTNLSVGYYDEHKNSEMLDVGHLVALSDACLKVDWEALPTARVPVPKRMSFGGHSSFRRNAFGNYGHFSQGVDELNWMSLEELVESYPDITAALLCNVLNDANTAREWLVQAIEEPDELLFP